MSSLVELIPIIAFFICYQLTNIYIATMVMMAVSFVQVIISLAQKGAVPIERWVNATMLIILGSITLISKNNHFIKLKPTIGYIISAIIFKVTAYRQPMTIPEKTFGKLIRLPKKSWLQLNNVWVAFFCMLGILNLVVAYNTTTDTWVYFKFFGVFGLFVLFMLAQIIYFLSFKKNGINYKFLER